MHFQGCVGLIQPAARTPMHPGAILSSTPTPHDRSPKTDHGNRLDWRRRSIGPRHIDLTIDPRSQNRSWSFEPVSKTAFQFCSLVNVELSKYLGCIALGALALESAASVDGLWAVVVWLWLIAELGLVMARLGCHGLAFRGASDSVLRSRGSARAWLGLAWLLCLSSSLGVGFGSGARRRRWVLALAWLSALAWLLA